MKKETKIVIGLVLLLGLLLGGLFLLGRKEKNVASTTKVSALISHINTDDDDEKINWDAYQQYEYQLSKSLVITDEGVYRLSGKIRNGNITIRTNGNVKLILNGVSITNQEGPAILVENASDVVIETVENSINSLEDGNIYLHDNTTEVGTILSHDDLTFQGNGTLIVTANKEDAIVSNDDLKFVSGNYEITSMDDGIRGKDSVYIQNGTFKIVSQGDGIKSTNTKDTGKGFVYIQDGHFEITSLLDGIQAEKQLQIQKGNFQIEAGKEVQLYQEETAVATQNTKSEQAKALKAEENIIIQNGTFHLQSSSDALHSSRCVGIQNGTFEITAKDDGIHADEEVVIEEGKVTISNSYEGIEGARITIHGGQVQVNASDDGINIAGGNDSSSKKSEEENDFSTRQDAILTIDGGEISINALGDGIDVNGGCYLNGGVLKVEGPVNDGNAAIDYDLFFEVNGGTLFASGSSGMMQGCSPSSKTYSLSIVLDKTYGKNDQIFLLDSKGKEVFSYQSDKDYDSLVIASPKLKKNKTYTLKVNQQTIEEISISSIVTEIGKRKQVRGR